MPLGFLGLVFSLTAIADEQGMKRVKSELVRAFPELAGATVSPAQVPGLYAIEYDTKIIYATEDGKYLFVGDVVDLGTRTNLTEDRRAAKKGFFPSSMGLSFLVSESTRALSVVVRCRIE